MANYLPVEGGSIYMPIDSITPLGNLIERLYGNWQLIETGKAYWIGYTNDMFSIAARGDNAIGPLINLVENSANDKAKLGAIYTIHLIGIKRKIVGRFEEKFADTNARKALLYLLKYPDWQPTIMELLIKDPWKSDVPDLIRCLHTSDSDCWAVVDGLSQYELENTPFRQKIPDNLRNIVLKLRYRNPEVLESNFDFEGQMQEVLDSLIALKNDSIIVERSLLNRPLWGNMRYKLGQALPGDRFLKLSVGDFLDSWAFRIFKELGNKLQYYVENGKLYICSAESAKKRWIDWWAKSASTFDKK
ncbi:hypothetical protein GCM10011511_14240 [Puia dinghuensis]|uniref:Uncharacterized protein n=2 Tax=Puia dinghuensis TaxID=1792502 RepID=A0A8J2UAY2_9BACT|nr:hypothetical protein GCM10011511_14240 [Puia dinghuensis]